MAIRWIRDPAAVARDVEYEYISRRSAFEDYGVVLDSEGAPDQEGTDARRETLRENRR